jgi:hypothetical protein
MAMDELAHLEGKRVEVEIDGRRVCGRVVRGPARKPMLLEERGPVGDVGTGCHAKLTMLRIWRGQELAGCRIVKVLTTEGPSAPPARRRRRKPDWAEAVEVAAGDPLRPPDDWQAGQIAWAEAVHTARRQVDRGRRAMVNALKKAAG